MDDLDRFARGVWIFLVVLAIAGFSAGILFTVLLRIIFN